MSTSTAVPRRAAANDWADVNPALNITLTDIRTFQSRLVQNLGIQTSDVWIQPEGYGVPGRGVSEKISQAEWRASDPQSANACNAWCVLVPDSDPVNVATLQARLRVLGDAADPMSAVADYLLSLWTQHGRTHDAILAEFSRTPALASAFRQSMAKF